MADKITSDRRGDSEFEDIDISMPQFDDIRLDAPLDGGGTSHGRGRKPDTPAKKIAVGGLKQLGKGVGNAFKNELYKEVPALAAINSEVQSTYTEFKGLKDELAGQLGPMLTTLEDATRKVLPKAEKLLPKKLYSKLSTKLEERAKERASEASTVQTKAQMEGQVIQDELAAIFAAEQQNRRSDALEEKKQELTKMALDSTRHKQQSIQLTHLYDAVRSTELFHRTVHTAYLKKSLELKYKHLFIARDTFNLLSKSMATFEGYYKGILRNTSLPDMMKVKIGDYHRKNVTDQYGTLMSNFMGKARRHIIDKIKNGVEGFAANAGTFVDQVGMAADMNQTMEEMTGGPKKFTFSDLLAKGLGRAIGAVGGGAIAKRFAQKAHPMLKDMNKGLDYLKSTAFVKMANLKRNWEGSDSRVLDFLASFIPDFKPTDRGGNDLLDKPKEPVPFDVLTRQSIVEIIPGYLSKILQSTESMREGIGFDQTEQQVFNMYNRKFTTTSELMESMHERMYGRDQDRQYFFSKAMGALQAGQIRKNPDQDPSEIYKEYEKDIHRFLINHGVRREILDLDKISRFIGSNGEDSSAYVNRIIEGFEHDPVKVLKSIYDGLTDGEGKLDRHMVQDLNNAIMSYYNQDNYITELPKATETYGYRWALSDKVSARERDELQARIDKYTGKLRLETLTATEKQNLSDRAAAGDEEAMNALDSLAARQELDSKMGLMGDRNEINLRGIERIQAGGIKYGTSELEGMIKGAREDAMRDYAESDVAAAQWQDIKDKTGLSKVEEFVRERREALKKKSKDSMNSVKDMFGIDHDVDLYEGLHAKAEDKINRGVDWTVQMIQDPKAREEYIERKKQDLSDKWDATKELGKDAITEVRKAIENPEEAYQKAKDAVQKKYDEAADAFRNSETGKAVIEKVDELSKKGKEAYEKHTPESVKKLISDIGKLAAKAPDEARSLINQVEDSLTKAYTDHVPEDARKSIAETKEAVEKAIREQSITAARVVEQLARDPEYREKVKGKVKKSVADAVDTTAETLDEAITDPSRTARKLKIAGKKAVRSAKDIGAKAVSGAKSVGEAIAATAGSVHESVVGSLSEENQKTVREAEKAIQEKVTGAAKTVAGAMPKSKEELLAKITAAKDTVVDLGKKTASTVADAFTPSEKEGPPPFDPATFGPIIRSSVADGIVDAFTKYQSLGDKIASAFASVKPEPEAEVPDAAMPGVAVPPPTPPTGAEGSDFGSSINDTLGQFFALYRDNSAAQAKLLDEWKAQVNEDHDAIFSGIGYISKTLREMPPAIASGTAMPDETSGGGGAKTYRELFKNTGKSVWRGARKVGGAIVGFYKDFYAKAFNGIGKAALGVFGKDGVVSKAVGGVSTLANSMYNAMVKHPDYVDIYLKGHENEQPLVTKRQQEDKDKGVFFKKSGERVKRSKDINEPVVDKDGNLLITEEDLKVGLVMPDGSPLNRFMGGLNKFMKGYFGVYAAALKGAGSAVGTVAKALFGTKGEPYVDIYRKDEVGKDYKPILTALRQERDPGVFFKDGKRVRNSEDITEPVYSPDGKPIINQDDIDHGLVGADNRPISTKKGRAGLISKVLDIGKAIAPGVGKAIGKIGELYKDIYSKLFGLGVGAVKGVGKMAGSFINRLFGFDVAGNNKKLIELVTNLRDDVAIISAHYKHNVDDEDNDGDIDGTYEDQMKNKEKNGPEKDKSPTPAGKAEAEAAKVGILERLFGGGKGKDGKDGEDGGGFFEDMLKWKALKWFGKKLGKFKHFLKLAGKGSMLRGAWVATKGLSKRGIGKVAGAFAKGGAVRTAAGRVAGAFAKGGAVRTAAGKTGTWIAEHGGKAAVEGLGKLGAKVVGKGGVLRTAKAAVLHSARSGVLSKVGAAATKVGGKIAGSRLVTGAGAKLAAAGGIKGAGRVAGKFLGKAAGPLAALTELGFGGYDAYKAFKAGDNRGGSKAVGGALGGAGGALGGAALGASIGSIVPGIGTAIGGLLGGVIGSFAGGGAGKWLGGKAHDAIVHDKGVLSWAPGAGLVTGLIRGIRGNDNEMTEKEIEQGRKKLERRVAKNEPGYDKILSEYNKAIEDKNWKRARQLCGKEADGIIKSLWKHSITGKIVGGTTSFLINGLFGKKDEEMSKEEIEKVRAKYQSLMKKGGTTAKNAEKLLNKFDDYVADENWKEARKLANMEKTGLWGKIFGDSHGKTQWGKVAGVVGGALLGGPVGALLGYGVGALFTKADTNKPMTEKEVADARARLLKLQEKGNKAAGKILEQFDEAVTEMNWKKARKLVGEDVTSNLEKLGSAVKTTAKWTTRIATLGLSTLFETDQEKPLTDAEIKKFTDKMRFLISKGGANGKLAEKKLEKFEEAVAAQKWEKARQIARMPDESKITKAAKATVSWLFGDDEKPMTEEEMKKFRDSMSRKIQMGSKSAQKKLDAFEDAVGAQRWKRARTIAGTPDDGIVQKVGKGIGKGIASTWRFLFGGDGAAMSESEINTARKRMEWACTEGKKGAQKRLDLFNDYVQDEKWEKARALAKMPYENAISRGAKAVKGWLFGDDKQELSAEEIDKFRGECEQRIADGNKKAEKVLREFNKAVDLENWEMARKISGNKDWGIVGKVGKGIKKVWDFFAGNSDYDDCMKIKEELEEKSLDDDTGMVEKGLEEFMKLVRRQEYNAAMDLAKDLQKLKPNEIKKKYKISTDAYDQIGKDAEALLKRLEDNIAKEKGFFPSIKKMRLTVLKNKLKNNPGDWNTEFLDNIREEMSSITGEDEFANEDNPDDSVAKEGERLVKDIEHAQEKFGWLTSPIKRAKLASLKSEVQSDITTWCDETIKTWKDRLKEIDDSYNRNGNSENGGGYADEDAGKEVEEEVQVVDEEVEKKRKRLDELKKKEFEARFNGNVLTDDEKKELGDLRKQEAEGGLEEGTMKTVKQKRKIAPKLKADNGKADYEQDAGPDEISNPVEVVEGSPFKEKDDTLLTALEKAQGKTIGGNKIVDGHEVVPAGQVEDNTSFEGKFTKGVKAGLMAAPNAIGAAADWVHEKDVQATGAILSGANKFGNAVINGTVNGAKAVGAAFGKAVQNGYAPTVHGGGSSAGIKAGIAIQPSVAIQPGKNVGKAIEKAATAAEFTKDDEPYLTELAKFGRGCGAIMATQYAMLGADDWNNGNDWLINLKLPLDRQDKENGFFGHMCRIDSAAGEWFAGLTERKGLRQKVLDIMVKADDAGKKTSVGPYELGDILGHSPTWQELCDDSIVKNEVPAGDQPAEEVATEEVHETKQKEGIKVAGEELVDGKPTAKQKAVDAISRAMGNPSALPPEKPADNLDEESTPLTGEEAESKFAEGGFLETLGNVATGVATDYVTHKIDDALRPDDVPPPPPPKNNRRGAPPRRYNVPKPQPPRPPRPRPAPQPPRRGMPQPPPPPREPSGLEKTVGLVGGIANALGFAKGGFTKKFALGGIGNFVGNLFSSDGMDTDRAARDAVVAHIEKVGVEAYEKIEDLADFLQKYPMDPKDIPAESDDTLNGDTIEAIDELLCQRHPEIVEHRLNEQFAENGTNPDVTYTYSGDREKMRAEAESRAKSSGLRRWWLRAQDRSKTREFSDRIRKNLNDRTGDALEYSSGGYINEKDGEETMRIEKLRQADDLDAYLANPSVKFLGNPGQSGAEYKKHIATLAKWGWTRKEVLGDYADYADMKERLAIGEKMRRIYSDFYAGGGYLSNPQDTNASALANGELYADGGFGEQFLTKPTGGVDADGTPIVAGEAGTEAIIPLTKRPGNLLMRLGDKIRRFLSGNKPEGEVKPDVTTTDGEASVHASDPDSEPMTNYLAKQLSDIIGPVDQKQEFEDRFAEGGFTEKGWNPFSAIANKVGMLKDAVASTAHSALDGVGDKIVDTVSGGPGSVVSRAMGLFNKPDTETAANAAAVEMSAPVMQSRIASANSGAAAEQVAAMTAVRNTQAEKTDQLLAATNKLVALLSSVMSKNGVKIDGIEDLADAVASTSTNNTAIQPTTIINSPDSTDSMEQAGIDMRKAQG